MPRVFLSYRHVEPDQSIAKFIYRYLVDRDHDVFFDSVDIPVGAFWNKEIKTNVERTEYFVPLVSLAYLNSPYILEHELSVAARLLKNKKIEGILQVNLAFDGKPPDAVQDVVNQIQFFKWRSPDDTSEVARSLAAILPAPKILVKGMRSFTSADAAQFLQLGRAERVSQFVALLSQPANRLTLLHGVSGSGKTSFIKAGVLPQMRHESPIAVELERDTPEELDALLSGLDVLRGAVIIFDQFEQSLVRLSTDKRKLGEFATAFQSRLQTLPTPKLVFCIRDEYRTAFDTMLPVIASQCALFPLLPLEVHTAANVMGLLLENARVAYDPQFLPTLCDLLAEGVPRTVLPALLQVIAQHCQNNHLTLNNGSWDRLLKPGNSLFEQHIGYALLRVLPSSVPRLDASRTLAALTSGNVKSPFKSATKIADDCGVKQASVRRTLEVAALPTARIVTVQIDSHSNIEQYRLSHDLFAPAVQSLARRAEAEEAKRNRFRLTASLVFGAVTVAVIFYFLYRSAESEKRESKARELAAYSTQSLSEDPEKSILLGMQALNATIRFGQPPVPAAEEALHQAILSSRVRATLRSHSDSVHAVTYSPDGRRLATASSDKTAKVWDAQSGKELLTLHGHSGGVLRVAFSPDGKRLATAGNDGAAKVWDAWSGQELLTLGGHSGGVLGVAFSPDGKRLATAGNDGSAKVWDAGSGKELVRLTLPGYSGHVVSVAFSADGKRLAVGSSDNTAKVLEAWNGRELLNLRGHSNWVTSVAFSPDGKRLATASYGGTAKVWDSVSGQELLTLRGHSGGVLDVAFSPDGKHLATASADETAKLWDAVNGQELLTLRGHEDQVSSVAFTPDGKSLATASLDKAAKVWDVVSGQELLTLRGSSPVQDLAFSPNGKSLATATDNETKVWDAGSGKELLTLRGQYFPVAFSADGKRLATASGDAAAKVWDAESGKELLTLRGHESQVDSVAFSPDGKRLATASDDETARVWDAESGKELLTLRGHNASVNGVAISPDGKRIATASDDETAKVWDAESGQELLTLHGHSSIVFAVAFSPNGKLIATASNDKTAKVWDAVSGRELHTLRGHLGSVFAVAFSPDGKRIATASDDKTAKVWDAGSGKELLSLRGHTKIVTRVAFSPGGKRLATASEDGTVQVYTLDIQELMNLARSRVTRNPPALTRDECKRYFQSATCPPLP